MPWPWGLGFNIRIWGGVGHRYSDHCTDQPWCNVGGDYRRMWISRGWDHSGPSWRLATTESFPKFFCSSQCLASRSPAQQTEGMEIRLGLIFKSSPYIFIRYWFRTVVLYNCGRLINVNEAIWSISTYYILSSVLSPTRLWAQVVLEREKQRTM